MPSRRRLTASRIAALFAIAAASCMSPDKIAAPTADAPEPIAPAQPNAPQYIVVVNDSVSDISTTVRSLRTRVRPIDARFNIIADGSGTDRTFTQALHGYVDAMSDSSVALLRRDPRVAYIEPDAPTHIVGSIPWGLDRIDQHSLPLDGSYTPPGDGSGVVVYIIDTGIHYSHVEFGGRATFGVDEVTSGGTGADCNGHGTHVSGIVGGQQSGVAKAVTLVAVRALDCSGSGFMSQAIAGLDWVVTQKQASPSTPMVVNMSLGGPPTSSMDDAIAAATAAGVTVVVAAGNSTDDACSYSPARAPSAITVGATSNTDAIASFSNYGTCVDIFAPGVNILSSWYTGDAAFATLSGTSMASPAMAGAVALYLAANPTATPATVATQFGSNATAGAVTGALGGAPNKLLYTGWIGTSSPPSTPTAAFLSSCTAFACTFDAHTSTDDHAISTYKWSFPDGSSALGIAPKKTFVRNGSYAVTLTITDALKRTATTTDTLRLNVAPVTARYAVSCVKLTCTFDASSSTSGSKIASYLWHFGTTAASGQAVRTTFKTPVTVPLTLIVKDAANTADTVKDSVRFTDNPPTATMTVNCVRLLCTFASGSSTDDWGIASVHWDFGDGHTSAVTKTGAIVHTYATSGQFTATLRVADVQAQADSTSRSVTVLDNPPSAHATAACKLRVCTFSSTGSHDDGKITLYHWNFGDGSAVATGLSVTHTYPITVTTYSAWLAVTDDAAQTDTAAVSATAGDRPPSAAFTSTCKLLVCRFIATTSTADAGIKTYAWTFGNSKSGTGSAPTMTYASSGTYTVELTITDANGTTATVSHAVTPGS